MKIWVNDIWLTLDTIHYEVYYKYNIHQIWSGDLQQVLSTVEPQLSGPHLSGFLVN